MLGTIKSILQQFINDIDTGNSNITETQQEELLNLVQKISSKELSKTDAADYIGVSKSTFDNYVRKRLLPKGVKSSGFKELRWYKSELNKYKKK